MFLIQPCVNLLNSLPLEDKITLIFPPATLPTSPYSSLPYLRGGIESEGIIVDCIDLNVEAYDYWLSEKYNKDAYSSCYIKWVKSFFKSSELELLDKEKYSTAKNYLDNFFNVINKGLNGKSLTLGGYVISNFRLSSESINKLAIDEFDPLSCFYKLYLSQCEFKSDVIGISVTYDFQLIPTLLLAFFVKHAHPDFKIILGGASILYLKDFFINNSWVFDWVDLIIIGDGVAGIKNILKGKKPSLSLCRIGSNVIEEHYNDDSDNNILPYNPNYDGLPLEKYLSPKLTGIIMASEGCYYGKCSFCVPSKGKNFKYHKYSIENVVLAINHLQKSLDTDLIFFGDDSIDTKHLIKILSNLDSDIFWQGEFRIEPVLSNDSLYILKKKGCLQILLGLESSSERVRNLMKKGIKKVDIERILNSCRENNIKVNIQTIIGFPSETLEESYDTVRFLYENKNSISSCALSAFCLYKGSDVYNNPDKYHIEIKTHDFVCEYNPLTGISNFQKHKLSKAYFESLSEFIPANNFFIDGPMGNHAMIYYKHNISI